MAQGALHVGITSVRLSEKLAELSEISGPALVSLSSRASVGIGSRIISKCYPYFTMQHIWCISFCLNLLWTYFQLVSELVSDLQWEYLTSIKVLRNGLEILRTLNLNYQADLGGHTWSVWKRSPFEELKGSEAALKMRLQADNYDSTTKIMRSRYLTHKNIAQWHFFKFKFSFILFSNWLLQAYLKKYLSE